MGSNAERLEAFGNCPKCGSKYEYTLIIYHGFLEHEEVTAYCDKCGKEITISTRGGDLHLNKGLSYSKKK